MSSLLKVSPGIKPLKKEIEVKNDERGIGGEKERKSSRGRKRKREGERGKKRKGEREACKR